MQFNRTPIGRILVWFLPYHDDWVLLFWYLRWIFRASSPLDCAQLLVPDSFVNINYEFLVAFEFQASDPVSWWFPVGLFLFSLECYVGSFVG